MILDQFRAKVIHFRYIFNHFEHPSPDETPECCSASRVTETDRSTSGYMFITDIGINLVISHSAIGAVSGRFEPHILAGSI